MPTYLVVGASRGIGNAVATHLAGMGACIVAVSRTPPDVGKWVQADVGTTPGIDQVIDAIGDYALDGLLFLGGICEKGAFTPEHDFLKSSVEETRRTIAVNLTAPILLSHGLAKNLGASENGRIVLMGSMSGVQNNATREVANTATKFGLQGAAEALNLSLRSIGVTVTVINPDNVATREVTNDIVLGQSEAQVPIPIDDLNRTIDYILGLSVDSVPTVINLRQTKPSERG